jgi:1-acyl-sn-glycerol-3-phosphate acyltransferase
MMMGPHLAWVARHGEVDVTLSWGEPFAFDQQSDRKQVARALETEIRRRTVRVLRGRADEPLPHSFLPENRV